MFKLASLVLDCRFEDLSNQGRAMKYITTF